MPDQAPKETEGINAIPACPRCGGMMHGCRITLQDMVLTFPFNDEMVDRRPDGYALPYPYPYSLLVICPTCSQLSQLTTSEGWEAYLRIYKLIPTRRINELVDAGEWGALRRCVGGKLFVPESPEE